ncbi:hypothetical protein [Bradyrhizobium sp. Tv2a-2]|uniref:hypothetical protein n=1 Tax=Bradyrhizobium sp. Tv2a-2 TaxID=113395 RepID=UPI00042672ED|nr:hypothetical protein [Bradyrhizobium sp. Tv2a-2]
MPSKFSGFYILLLVAAIACKSLGESGDDYGAAGKDRMVVALHFACNCLSASKQSIERDDFLESSSRRNMEHDLRKGFAFIITSLEHLRF